MQTRLDGLAVAFFALCVVLFFYVSYGSCPSYLQSWLGFLPMIVVMSAVTGAYTFLASPVKGNTDDKILQIWLQVLLNQLIVSVMVDLSVKH